MVLLANQQSMWSNSVNDGVSRIDVAAGLAAAAKASAGGLFADIRRLASDKSVVLCPAIRISETEAGYILVHCRNVQVDIASWSVLLLAIGVQKRWTELQVFNCQLTTEHLQTLGSIVALGTIFKLTLDFCTGLDDSEWAQAIPALLGSGSLLQHLSLRGNRCSDEVAQSLARALETNLQLKSLNLCRNAFSDQGASTLLRALRFNNTLVAVSLAENYVGDAACATVQLLVNGFEVRAEEEPMLVAAVDRVKVWNKELKGVNKKRAKEGLGELPELPLLGDARIDDGTKTFTNSRLECIDLSGNDQITMVGLDALRTLARTGQPLSLVLRNIPSAQLVLQSHEHHEFIAVYT